VVCANEPLLQIFRITGLSRILTIHATMAGALAAVESEGTPPGPWVRRRSIPPGVTQGPPRPGTGRAAHSAGWLSPG
jgi:hypothetical protein